jgi:phage tail tube protein FII
MQIPNQVHGFNVYVGTTGSKLAGIATVTLSVLNYMVDELKGAGIAGTVELIIAGFLQKFGMQLDFHATTSAYLELLAPTAQQIVCRAGIQYQDDSSLQLLDIPQRIVAMVYPKGLNLGKLDTGTKPGTLVDFSVVAIDIWFNNVKEISINPEHLVCKIGPTDYLANLRTMI